jgi:mono/diheme cytochrome c family protein
MNGWRAWLSALAVVPAMAAAAPAIAPVDPPPPASFDPALVARGAQLAAVGNCHDCHTAAQGKEFAGGRPLYTPFGVVHGTNITPDPETGIGRWSEAAFRRALHEGVDRDGQHLYPVFPYDHYTKLTDDDVAALYAFIMTRDPVSARTPPNRVSFPYNVRAFIGVWKNLYFEPGRFTPDPSQNAQWNRGAYLVEGAGHCGACHTPRNQLGAEVKERKFAGGETGSWHAPALNRDSPSPVPWTVAALDTYLRTGLPDDHAIAAGPMAPVVRNLSTVSAEDTKAMAVYVASWMGAPATDVKARARMPDTASLADAKSGASIYAGSCGACHDIGRTISSGGALHLSVAIAPALPTPANLIHLTLEGVAPPDGEPGRFMPGYAGALTNEQVATLVQYLRTEFAGKPPWPDVDAEVRKVSADREAP